jgi:hypothetical protein
MARPNYFANKVYDNSRLFDMEGTDEGDVPATAHVPRLAKADPASLEHPGAAIDERNGWHDRGNPLENFSDEAITLAADELGRLFQWLLTGGQKRAGPAPEAARNMTHHQLMKSLKDPMIVACRFFALLLRTRPDLLEGMQAKQIGKYLKRSPRMMAFYTMNFAEHFPSACKPIRRKSRFLTEQKLKARHEGKAEG